jgi:adenosylcobinamide-phosphate synthase
MSRRRGAAGVAVLVDALFGEPPTAVHPTALMGSGIARGQTALHTRHSDAESFRRGMALVSLGVVATWIAAAAATRVVRRTLAAHDDIGTVAEGVLLKSSLSVRALLSAGHVVERALRAGDLPEARRLLSYHLVSRNTSRLTGSQIAGAAIASLAENVSDSVVAPLLTYRLGGLPAAYAYRFANTADAMLGYRTPELEWFGKPAARLDDILNLAPSRLTALLIAAAAGAARGSSRGALRIAWRDASCTPSPNGGWPMAAMAGALGVRIEKVGVYVLGNDRRAPCAVDIGRARAIVAAVTALATTLAELT